MFLIRGLGIVFVRMKVIVGFEILLCGRKKGLCIFCCLVRFWIIMF